LNKNESAIAQECNGIIQKLTNNKRVKVQQHVQLRIQMQEKNTTKSDMNLVEAIELHKD
jgi:hypothetical protein